MRKIIKTIVATCLVSVFLLSCTKDFDTINIDPNNPAQPNTALLMSNAIRHIGNQGSGIAGWAKDLYPQFMAEIQYTSESRFQNKVYSYYPYYNGPLLDLQTIINLNTDEATAGEPYVQAGGSNVNQIAVARILKAFYFLHMTDRWGRIPYFDALQGTDNLTPKFDAQRDIYVDIFKELKEAAAQLDPASGLNGDILFDGDIAHWEKWANSLRMVAAIHLSNVDESLASSEFAAAAGSSIIASNDDNVYFQYLGDANNQGPLYNNYITRTDYAVSEKVVDVLSNLDDPRLPVYAEPTVMTGEYVGMPYGLANADDNLNQETVSLVGDKFTAQDYAMPITTYAQVQFMMAEAASRGWISGNAATFYTNGIEASMEQHGVAAPASYYTQSGVAYNPANALELIITQKWIANYQANGYESWADWRRTGIPTLDPGPEPLSDNGEIPRRQAYSNEEAGLNEANYKDAISKQGPDEFSTRVWWDGGNE